MALVRKHIVSGVGLQTARSFTLSPLYFQLWGRLKTLMHATPMKMKKHLTNAVFYACRTIRNRPGTFESVRQPVVTRVCAFIGSAGAHFEHLL